MLPCIGREHYRLSVTDGCRCWGDDESSMRFRVPKWLVNIAHYSKLYTRGNGPSSGKLRPSSGDALGPRYRMTGGSTSNSAQSFEYRTSHVRDNDTNILPNEFVVSVKRESAAVASIKGSW